MPFSPRRFYQGPISDHFDGHRFFNPWGQMQMGFKDALKWQLTRTRCAWPPYQELAQTDKPPERVTDGQLRLSYVGHATVLLQSAGLNILIDPFWSQRPGSFGPFSPRRRHPPGIRFADLPPVDLVLVSHNHYDHLDLPTLRLLCQRDQPRIIVPLGNDLLIRKTINGARVSAHDWAESVNINPEVQVSLMPAQHWSCRGLFDRDRALWAAFVLQTAHGNTYLLGDSGYGDGYHFRWAAERYGPFRLAVLPIGSSDPRWFMGYQHMSAEDAVAATCDLDASFVLPVHYGVLHLADTGHDEPLQRLHAAIARHNLPPERFQPLPPGGHCFVP